MMANGTVVVVFHLSIILTAVSYAVLFNENYCPLEARVPFSRGTIKFEDNGTYCPCSVKTCLPLCCPNGHKIFRGCVPIDQEKSSFYIDFPQIYDSETLEPINLSIKLSSDMSRHIDINFNDHFHLFERDPCHGGLKYRLNPNRNAVDEFKLLNNGSIYLVVSGGLLNLTNYCFGFINGRVFSVALCLEIANTSENKFDKNIYKAFPIGMTVSVPFLLVTFIVYSIVPELRNMHGLTLRSYIGPLFVAYIFLAVVQIAPPGSFRNQVCIAIAFIIHFSFLASFFWLNVMCFDIWWTFGGFRSLQGSAKQRERKKFIIYSIYAWGCASFFTAICLIMDFAPNIPSSFIRPQFGEMSCWFMTDSARAIYFYAPMGVTILCNISLFISTALKILQHRKDTAHHLKGMDSHRHDDNRQWFNLYLKLFIVMGINWSMEIVSWICKGAPEYVWYITDLANTLQGVIIFIIFVWKPKIKRLLLKRFGRDKQGLQSRNSTKSGCHSSTSRTYTSTMTPLQEGKLTNHNQEKNCSTTIITDESDCL